MHCVVIIRAWCAPFGAFRRARKTVEQRGAHARMHELADVACSEAISRTSVDE